ncbi:hypothetical protein N7481_004212 [Penicillium waksmanii]|uniref:uncharacterized protein n=1 Tax=Penicillium waksmanii TaxID=69791 RepID=UPI00254810CF|nr:uncharacterized protein N7481_004212 [Penicillium waksmanii]KAJ5989002.1 hypothetical protein N7481_004212 [Penicillium waksmanii]
MLIDGQKWACEACIRGHRVTSCKHHDRPLIRIKRKGRPFATCTVCHSTPCTAPSEHARAKREAELKTPSKVTQTQHTQLPTHERELGSHENNTHLDALGLGILGKQRGPSRCAIGKKAAHGRLYPRHHNPHGFLPIAPRPSDKDAQGASSQSSTRISRSGSTSASASESHTPVYHESSSRRGSALTADWSGSEGSGPESSLRTQSTTFLARNFSTPQDSTIQSFARSAPEDFALDPLLVEHTFDPMYSLLPSTISGAQMAQTVPMISPLEGSNPFDTPLDPSLTLNDSLGGYLESMDIDVTEGLSDEVFHIEDWSRYMWSPETGFEHLDTGFPPATLPPVTQ